LVDVIEGRSGVHRWDDADMLFGSFECYTHCFLGGESVLVAGLKVRCRLGAIESV
jgi:hypothetical protein